MRTEDEVQKTLDWWKRTQTDDIVSKIVSKGDERAVSAALVQGIIWALEWTLGRSVNEIAVAYEEASAGRPFFLRAVNVGKALE